MACFAPCHEAAGVVASGVRGIATECLSASGLTRWWRNPKARIAGQGPGRLLW